MLTPKPTFKTKAKYYSKIAVKNISWLLMFLGRPLYSSLLVFFLAFLLLSAAAGVIIKNIAVIAYINFIKVIKIMTSFPLSREAFLSLKKDDISVSIHPRANARGFLETAIKSFILPTLSKLKLISLRLKLKKAFKKPTKTSTKKDRVNPYQDKRIFKKRYLLLFLLLISPFALIFGIWNSYLQDLPSPTELTERKVDISTKIYSRDGTLLYKIFENENRSPVALKDIPVNVRNATLAIEDANFYTHPGFSIKGITRAILHNYKNKGELTGGSTITQQLVKNTLLSSEKTFARKIREVVLAFLVEWNFNKNQILEMYLNEVSYGGAIYGVQEASRYYFGRDVQTLDLAEAALLAGLPKSPTKYSPFGPNPDYAIGRQKEVLRLMEENGYITKDQRKRAEGKRIVFAPNRTDIKAPHFVMYVRELLEERFGKEVVEKGGLEVQTTIDLEIQDMAQVAVKEEVEKLKNLNVGNAAAVVLNPKTGEILAMVGSTDYFNTQKDGNVNLTTRLRQPGSSIKLVNYSYALSHGYTAASILADTPITYKLDNNTTYTPKNYDGKFRGNLTLRSAFAESRNIPAVKVLNSYGVDKMIEQGTKMGITTWNDPRGYGLSLTLGGGEVRLVDLALAYASVANYGTKPPLTPITKVTNYKGSVIQEGSCPVIPKKNTNQSILPKPTSTTCVIEVLDKRVAFIITDILKDNKARTPAFGANSQLVIPNHPEVAVKTGTSNNLRDNLTVGYTKDYLVAVWVGNNDNSPMSRIASGLTGASTIFNRIMVNLLTDKPSVEWEKPEGVVKLPICAWTGTLACSGCPVVQEYFLEESKPQKACNPDQFKTDENKEGMSSEASAQEGQILPEAASTER